MKLLILVLLFLSFPEKPVYSDKTDMICHKWIAIGGKQPGHEEQFSHNKYYPVRIWFKKDGVCVKEQNWYGKSTITGTWKFSTDSSNIMFTATESEIPSQRIVVEPSKYHVVSDTIIKLTPDTLILGTFFYMPPDSTYVHHDLYYVIEE
jgi:hypothetical protein